MILSDDEARALREAGRREGLSQSELIRRGIRLATQAGSGPPRRPTVGWLRLSRSERAAVDADELGDRDGTRASK